MSSPYIDKLEFEFKQNPESNPSVLVSFNGMNFPYENGLSTKMEAQYSSFKQNENVYAPNLMNVYDAAENYVSFSQGYLNDYMGEGLKELLCPGFDEVYIRIQKTLLFGSYNIRFELYATNPTSYLDGDGVTLETPFATVTCQVPEPNKTSESKNLYKSPIYNSTNDQIGHFSFYYHNNENDELFQLDEGFRYFYYQRSGNVTTPISLGTSETYFSENYLNDRFNFQFIDFSRLGAKDFFVKTVKNDSEIVFNFYLENPEENSETTPFATSTFYTEDAEGMYEINIESSEYGNLGKIQFTYYEYDDEIANWTVDKYFKLNFESAWKNATLFYKDIPTDGILNEDDLYNNYLVNENGNTENSKNYWDLTKDITINTSGLYCLRIRLIDTNAIYRTTYYSTVISCANARYSKNEISYFKPVFQYDKSQEFNPTYCISENPTFYLNVPTESNDFENVSLLMNKVIYYRYSESQNTINQASWQEFSSLNGNTEFVFNMEWLGASGLGGTILDGEKNIVLQISDGMGNTSEVIKYDNELTEEDEEYQTYLWKKDSIRGIYLYRQPPNSIVFDVIGSSGSNYYTGMYRDQDGRFIPSNKILVNIYANDNLGLDMEYKLYLGNSEESAEWRKFDYPNDKSTYYNIPFFLDSESNYGVFENNYSANVNLIFRNSAGLSTDVQTRYMFYNTKILKTEQYNLKETTNSYKPVIEYLNGDEWVGINEQENFDTTVPKRSWREIFYPETHGFPVDALGNIDVTEALKIKDGNVNYDAIKTKTETREEINEEGKPIQVTYSVVEYDDEQRPLTIWNESLLSKKYRTLQSNSKVYNSETGETEGLAYWVIDNQGYSEFQLEFEHFHLDQTAHVQINDLAPFTGSCLVVYDASEEGATIEYIDKYGRTAYKLGDTTKLKMIAAYSGDGINANRLYPEENAGSLNATVNGAFTTEKFETKRICLIFYSDGAGVSSGFKIKASPARESDWINWEVDNRRGEVWIHKLDTEQLEGNTFKTITTQAGFCPDTTRMSYEYSDTAFDLNYEDGSIRFYDKQDGQIWGTFCYFNYSVDKGAYKRDEYGRVVPMTYTYVLADDDLVDYKDVAIYVSCVDENGKIQINKDNNYTFANTENVETDGKIASNITLYKDSGLIEFSKNCYPPKNRMFADYYSHSYYRLTDDGYGNLYFYDEVIVPDRSDIYSDYTYVDLKVVNEGEATLKNGRIKFTFRGIASGGSGSSDTITSVLNPDRPWDIQEGTPEETFEQVGGVVSTAFNFPPMTWANALSIYNGELKSDSETTYKGGKTEIPFQVDMEMKKEIYIRVVWSMFTGGSENSPTYITPTSSGEKCFSGEIEGQFYTVQI